jgi:hypothetical protein
MLRTIRSVARWGRYLSTGTLKRIPMDLVTNEFAFSFAPDGWNYFRAIVAEYDNDPAIELADSVFFRFFHDERIRSVRYLNDLLFLHDPRRRARQEFNFYLGTYPWGDHVGGGPWGHHHDVVEGADTQDLYGYRRNIWYRPGDDHPLEIEWRQTLALYRSIRKRYSPVRYGSLPEVTLLVRRDGAMRAVRYNGQHRLAILSHLGYERVTALVPSAASVNESLTTWSSCSRFPKVVDEDEIVVREANVDNWQYVKRGLCSAAQALEIFHAFFELNGRERIAYLGLPPAY